MSTARDKMTALIKAMPDRQLVEVLLATDVELETTTRGADDWLAHYTVWLALVTEVESRYDVQAQMDAWAAEAVEDVRYVEALVAALPVEVLA
jgi:hypothetical protein